MDTLYEWDEAKRRANRTKHGLDFTAIEEFDWHRVSTRTSVRHGETRFIATSYLGDRLHVAVYTMRGDIMRVISLRRASRQEARDYDQPD